MRPRARERPAPRAVEAAQLRVTRRPTAVHRRASRAWRSSTSRVGHSDAAGGPGAPDGHARLPRRAYSAVSHGNVQRSGCPGRSVSDQGPWESGPTGLTCVRGNIQHIPGGTPTRRRPDGGRRGRRDPDHRQWPGRRAGLAGRRGRPARRVRRGRSTCPPTSSPRCGPSSPPGRTDAAGRPPAVRRTSFLLELTAPPPPRSTPTRCRQAGQAGAAAAASTARGDSAQAATQVIGELPAAVPDAAVLYSTTTVLSGVAVSADAVDYDALTQLAGVTAVHPIARQSVENAAAATVTQAVQVWQALGNTGEDVSIGDHRHRHRLHPRRLRRRRHRRGVRRRQAQLGNPPCRDPRPPRSSAATTSPATTTTPTRAARLRPGPAARPQPAGLQRPRLPRRRHRRRLRRERRRQHLHRRLRRRRSTLDDARRSAPAWRRRRSLYALKVFGCDGSHRRRRAGHRLGGRPERRRRPLRPPRRRSTCRSARTTARPRTPTRWPSDNAGRAGTIVVASARQRRRLYDVGGSPGNAPRGIAVAASDDGNGDRRRPRRSVAPAGLVDGVRPGPLGRSPTATRRDRRRPARPHR